MATPSVTVGAVVSRGYVYLVARIGPHLLTRQVRLHGLTARQAEERLRRCLGDLAGFGRLVLVHEPGARLASLDGQSLRRRALTLAAAGERLTGAPCKRPALNAATLALAPRLNAILPAPAAALDGHIESHRRCQHLLAAAALAFAHDYSQEKPTL